MITYLWNTFATAFVGGVAGAALTVTSQRARSRARLSRMRLAESETVPMQRREGPVRAARPAQRSA